MITNNFFHSILQFKIFLEDLLYEKKNFSYSLISILVHIIFLIPMISITFNKDKISDIPLVLPIDMFIVEDETAAQEFDKKLNEIIPDIVEVENQPEEEIINQEISEVKEITKNENSIEAEEVILANESLATEEDFAIEKEIKPEEIMEEKKIEPENDFEIKLKEKPTPKEIIEQPDIEIALKKKPNKKTFEVSKVLKDLENKQEDFKKDQEETNEKQQDVFTEKVGDKMTISELELLKQQLYSCYTVPAGAKEFEDIKVEVQIIVNENKTVKEANVKNTSKMNSDSYYRTAGEAALRAFNHPNCSTLKLPDGKYDQWNEINFIFDFSWMFEKT